MNTGLDPQSLPEVPPQVSRLLEGDQWYITLGWLVGILCVVGAIKLYRMYQSSMHASPSSARGQMDPRKQQHQIRKQAKQWKRARAYSRAGECFASIGDHEQAIEMYRKAGAHRSLAQLYRQLRRWRDAAQAYEECGELEQAAVMHHSDRNFAKAGQLYARLGQFATAGDMAERAGNVPEAAAYYEQGRQVGRAARLYEQLGDAKKAATLYEQHFQQAKERYHDPTEDRTGKNLDEVNTIARLAADLYLQSEQSEKAAALFEQSGEFRKAAAVHEQAGRFQQAAQLYEQAGEEGEAARCYEQDGQPKRAALLRAQHLLQAGQVEAASRLFEEAGETGQAAELLERAGRPADAAQRYLAAQDYARAAELFLKANDRRQAAMAWEAGRRFKDAAALYEELGEADKARGLYEKLGHYYHAALLCQDLGHQGRTIELLQKVDTESDDYYQASLLLGDLFISQEMWDAARERYLKLVSRPGEPATLMEPLYRLATLAEKQKDYPAALQWYERILSHDVNYRDTMGRANLIKRALTSAKRAMAEAPKEASTVLETNSGGKPRRYRLIKKIGQGGMGIVYQAEDSVLNRVVAYKVLPPSVKEQPKVLASFLREARIAASLSHANIVAVYDAGHEAGDLYIVMEYVDGISLKERLQQVAPLPHDEFMHVALQLCQGLAYAHRHKVVHRDIKPANVMLGRDGQVKIMDFGLAKVVSDALADRTSVKGTPLYMAPEQVTGDQVDHQSDIYSLGCTLYRMATGRPPFTGGDLYYHHLHTPPEPPVSINPSLSPQLNRLLLTCLAKKKKERFNEVGVIIKALQAIPAPPGLSVGP
ncbi:MAG: protein kinase [Nitrospirae bacterium]|nr:protein kinase [Nitrospirota bacterium]